MPQKTFHIVCPDCSGELTIDAATGEILYHVAAQRKPAGGKTLEDLMQDLEKDKSRAEDIFEQERTAMKDRDRLLDEKFKEAMKRAEGLDDDKPPPSPFDLE